MNDIKTILTAITATCVISYSVYSIWKGRRVTKLPDDDISGAWQMQRPKAKVINIVSNVEYIQYPLPPERFRSHTI